MQTIVSGAYGLVPSVEFSSFANHKKHCDPRIIIVYGSVFWLVEQDLRKQFSSFVMVTRCRALQHATTKEQNYVKKTNIKTSLSQ